MDIETILKITPPIHNNYAYFQSGGFSPKLEPVTEEVIRLMQYQNRGPAIPEISTKMLDVFEDTRKKVAKALGAHHGEIMLNENVTVGINIVANGIEWKPGDNVILDDHAHPGNRVPWYNFVKRYGIELRYVKTIHDEAKMLDQFDNLLDERTRLVSISHVSRRTGQRYPAKDLVEICQAKDIPILFDGAQSFGVIPINLKVLDCDFYSFSGHKYVMAPQGTGGFYVRQDRINWIKPSWTGSHSEKHLDDFGNMSLQDGAKRFEFGTRNLADQGGFGKALDIWESVGWDTIFAKVEAYTDKMKAAFLTVPELVLETPMQYKKSSSIVTFHLPGVDAYSLYDSLREKERVLVGPSQSNAYGIRVATHVFNNDEDIERLVSGLLRVQKKGI